MTGGWRYRVASVVGAFTFAVAAVFVAYHPLVQAGLGLLPVLRDLPLDTAGGRELATEAIVAATVVTMSLWPLLKPRPRRILDTASIAVQRTLLAMVTLAAIGYFDYTYQLPRATLIVSMAILTGVLPVWFVTIRRQPRVDGGRTILIGDDLGMIREVLTAVDGPVLGYVSPPTEEEGDPKPVLEQPDGGAVEALDSLSNLGGLSRLDDVLVDYDVGTAVLAFARPDRAEFFGTLDTCYEHGVAAKIHRRHADVVLTNDTAEGELVEIDLEPWDWLDHVTKRAFDIVFATTALLIASPLLLLIAVAIKLDSPGPVLYRQTRTAAFGDTFTVAKFRSMVTDAEMESGATLSDEDDGNCDPRVTRIGRILRRTHLDEIPQLLAILRGEMSVVGPRPERPELDEEMESTAELWRRRWFVKPGLTGLAQINGVTGFEPEEKLRYDVAYIREQSFWFDLKIVIRQLWEVGEDIVASVRE
ncbi:sugar transferase [Halosegnis longus]|uniref:sugar transferase n=1 Tax=Halosegnis longus TaxID=2216012 RepID=UPI00096A4C1D|nr:sugar transferase [Salella cibi]